MAPCFLLESGALYFCCYTETDGRVAAYYTYIVECADGSLYTGWTGDVQQRIEMHNQGKGARYTRGRGPVILRACWQFKSRREAMSYEWHLKQLTRQQKQALIAKCDGIDEHSP
jgi:putative endonuclease